MRFTTLNWGRGGEELRFVNVHQLSNLGWIDLKRYIQDFRFEGLGPRRIGPRGRSEGLSPRVRSKGLGLRG